MSAGATSARRPVLRRCGGVLISLMAGLVLLVLVSRRCFVLFKVGETVQAMPFPLRHNNAWPYFGGM